MTHGCGTRGRVESYTLSRIRSSLRRVVGSYVGPYGRTKLVTGLGSFVFTCHTRKPASDLHHRLLQKDVIVQSFCTWLNKRNPHSLYEYLCNFRHGRLMNWLTVRSNYFYRQLIEKLHMYNVNVISTYLDCWLWTCYIYLLAAQSQWTARLIDA